MRACMRLAARTWVQLWQSHADESLLRMATDTFRWLAASSGPEDQELCRADLFVVLRHLFEATGAPAVLDEAIELGCALVKSATGRSRALHESNLSDTLRLRFEFGGSLQDIHDAVRYARDGLDPAAADVVRARRLSNLALSLRVRYEVRLEEADLEESCALFRRARKLAGEVEPERSRIGSNLSVSLRLFGVAHRAPEFLREAVELVDQTITDNEVDEIDKAGMLINAALAHLDLHSVEGRLGSLEAGASLLDEVLTHSNTSSQDLHVARLNSAYAKRLLATATPDDSSLLDNAVTAAQTAVDGLQSDSPDGPMAWAGLGRAHWLRFQRLHQFEDARRAIECRVRAAEQEFGAAEERALSAAVAGTWSMEVGEPLAAAYGYRRALGLLPEVTWVGLSRSARECVLMRFAGLASDAAAAAVASGEFVDAATASVDVEAMTDAVTLVEQGRSVLWFDAIRPNVLVDLRSRSPHLANKLVDLRERLDVLNSRALAGQVREES